MSGWMLLPPLISEIVPLFWMVAALPLKAEPLTSVRAAPAGTSMLAFRFTVQLSNVSAAPSNTIGPSC